MIPLCKHVTNSNGILCYDLSVDPGPLLELSSDEIAERVFTKTENLPAGVERIPLKTIHLNKSPMVAALGVLDEAVSSRLHIDRGRCESHWQRIMENLEEVCDKVADVMSRDAWQEQLAVPDPEFLLYQGFLSQADRRLCDQIRRVDDKALASRSFPFSDSRMTELLFRYRARNFPGSLTEEEKHQWEEFRFQRLHEKYCDDYYDLETYHSKIAELAAAPQLGDRDRQMLETLTDWAAQIL